MQSYLRQMNTHISHNRTSPEPTSLAEIRFNRTHKQSDRLYHCKEEISRGTCTTPFYKKADQSPNSATESVTRKYARGVAAVRADVNRRL